MMPSLGECFNVYCHSIIHTTQIRSYGEEKRPNREVTDHLDLRVFTDMRRKNAVVPKPGHQKSGREGT